MSLLHVVISYLFDLISLARIRWVNYQLMNRFPLAILVASLKEDCDSLTTHLRNRSRPTRLCLHLDLVRFLLGLFYSCRSGQFAHTLRDHTLCGWGRQRCLFHYFCFWHTYFWKLSFLGLRFTSYSRWHRFGLLRFDEVVDPRDRPEELFLLCGLPADMLLQIAILSIGSPEP